MKIKVKFHIKSWAGLEKKLPPPQGIELILSKGDKLGAKDLGGFPGSAFVITGPNLEISNVTDNGIDLMTNGLVEYNPPDDKGLKTINLRKDSRGLRYHVSTGETLVLVTQSMDSGFEVSIAPLEIVKE